MCISYYSRRCSFTIVLLPTHTAAFTSKYKIIINYLYADVFEINSYIVKTPR